MIKYLLFGICFLVMFSFTYSFEICPEEYSPVCGNDNITYFNECIMKNAGAQLEFRGVCNKDENLLEEPPIPKNQSEEYEEELKSELSILDYKNKDKTKKNVLNVCENYNQSVCNENPNCESYYKRKWFFFRSFDYCDVVSSPVKNTLQIDNNVDCPNIVDAVCGEDLITYPNSCYAKNQGVEILYQQRCEEIKCNSFDENSCLNYNLICSPTYSYSFLFFGEKTFMSCSFK